MRHHKSGQHNFIIAESQMYGTVATTSPVARRLRTTNQSSCFTNKSFKKLLQVTGTPPGNFTGTFKSTVSSSARNKIGAKNAASSSYNLLRRSVVDTVPTKFSRLSGKQMTMTQGNDGLSGVNNYDGMTVMVSSKSTRGFPGRDSRLIESETERRGGADKDTKNGNFIKIVDPYRTIQDINRLGI